jgi:hypothetical protein
MRQLLPIRDDPRRAARPRSRTLLSRRSGTVTARVVPSIRVSAGFSDPSGSLLSSSHTERCEFPYTEGPRPTASAGRLPGGSEFVDHVARSPTDLLRRAGLRHGGRLDGPEAVALVPHREERELAIGCRFELEAPESALPIAEPRASPRLVEGDDGTGSLKVVAELGRGSRSLRGIGVHRRPEDALQGLVHMHRPALAVWPLLQRVSVRDIEVVYSEKLSPHNIR